MNIIYLPKTAELGTYIAKLPDHPDKYKEALVSLASSVRNYSEQIKQILEVEDIVDSLGETGDEEK
jgi:HPt (histidine-containing phosphotransfer) domain-containing protein